MDKKIKTKKKTVDPTMAENKKWQEHVFTSAGRQILAEVLNGEIKQEIPSAYIGYFPQLESMEINQYPQFISGVTELPETNKKIDIISKEVQEDKTVLTVQVSNIGLEEAIKYNALIIMAYNKSRKIVPFTISAIKETQVLQTQDIPFQQLFEITMLISSEAEVTIELQPIVDASRINFDKGETGLAAENVQDALEEIVTKIGEATDSSTEQGEALNTHKEENVTNAEGVHGIKYDESATKLQYKKGEEWKDIPTGQKAEEDLKLHEKKKVSSVEGVHGFRYNSTNETLEIESEEGEWTEVGGGMAGALLSPVTNIKVKAGNTKLTVSWTDPKEETWAGTKVVYKTGSYPTSPKEGTLVVDNKVKDQYKTNGFEISALNNGTKYYFAFFPYDAKNKYSLNVDNRVTGTPREYKVMTAKINLNDENPETCVTYADDAVGMTPGSEEWDEFFGHYPCLLQNGAENAILQKNNYTKKEDSDSADITSGNSGDVMICYPLRGSKIITTEDELIVSVTDNPNSEDGFEFLGHTFNGTVRTKFYFGAYKGSLLNGKLRSLSGKKPLNKTSIESFRQYAVANGERYTQTTFYPLTYLIAMYILKFKSLNSQKAVGVGYRAKDINSIMQTGGTETKGMDWGEELGQNHVKVLGIEDFWGNLNEFVDGVVTNGTNILTSTGNFNNNGDSYETQEEFKVTSGQFISKVFGSNKLGFIPKECNGSSSTFFCDYGSVAGNQPFVFGGFGGSDLSVALMYGAFAIRGHASKTSTAYENFGGRLMCFGEEVHEA